MSEPKRLVSEYCVDAQQDGNQMKTVGAERKRLYKIL